MFHSKTLLKTENKLKTVPSRIMLAKEICQMIDVNQWHFEMIFVILYSKFSTTLQPNSKVIAIHFCFFYFFSEY